MHQGNLGKAIKLAGSEHFNELKDEVLNLMRHINEMDISELVEAVKRCTLYKVEINDYLDLIMVWYRDVLLYKATREIDKVVFKDQIDCSVSRQDVVLMKELRRFWTALTKQKPD